MSLTLNHVAVHKLNKEKGATKNATVKEGGSPLDPSNEVVLEMVQEINGIYGKKLNYIQYGTFHESGYVAPGLIDAYSKVVGSKKDRFWAVSKDLLEQFRIASEKVVMATGGYIVFADFTQNGVNYFLVAMVKDKSGITFDDKLVPHSIERIDLDKLHQAFKISFKGYSDYSKAADDEKSKINYLSFIAKSNDASDYFVSALGSRVGNSSTQATSKIIGEIFEFSKRKKAEGVFTKGGREVQEEFCEYMRTIGDGKLMNLDGVKVFLAGYVDPSYPDVAGVDGILDEFVSTLNSDEKGIPYEFAVSLSEVRKKSRVVVKSDSWDIKFDRKLLGSNETDIVFYDGENKKLIVNIAGEDKVVKLLEREIEELSSASESQE